MPTLSSYLNNISGILCAGQPTNGKLVYKAKGESVYARHFVKCSKWAPNTFIFIGSIILERDLQLCHFDIGSLFSFQSVLQFIITSDWPSKIAGSLFEDQLQ